MWPYWALFLIPAALALHERVSGISHAHGLRWARALPISWKAFALGLALMVGWRHQVGGDWENYLNNFKANADLDLFAIAGKGDPGYQALEWLAHHFDWSIYGVNLTSGTLFALGLVWFCRHLPRPWLAMAVSVPYLVIVLGMGYSRQGVALACLMAGLVALGDGRVYRFVVWAALAASFHKSAVLVLPMAALAAARNRWWVAMWVSVVTGFAYTLLLQDSVEALKYGYLEQRYQSQGALVRLWMNAIPAAILLLARKRFGLTLPQRRLWMWYSVFAIAALVTYFFSPSSTAVDRVALYLLPLQVVVFAYLPEVMGRRRGANTGWVLVALALYATVEGVWLFYSNYAYTWLPYQFYPLTDQFWLWRQPGQF